METKLTYHDPAELRLHALQKHIPAPDKKSTEWVAFVDSVNAGGILHPLIITPDKQIMDGGWRWRAAKELELTEVACLVRPESEAAVIITESLLHRKQMTRGAAVYLAILLVKEFVQSAESRRLQNLRKGVKTREMQLKTPTFPVESNFPESVRELAIRWGVSHATILQAEDVRAIFAKDAGFKAEWEPKLLSGECNLWNVKSAHAGGNPSAQTGRDEKKSFKQMQLMFEPLDAKAWSGLDEQKQEMVITSWKTAAAKIPKHLRQTIIEILKAA